MSSIFIKFSPSQRPLSACALATAGDRDDDAGHDAGDDASPLVPGLPWGTRFRRRTRKYRGVRVP